MTTGPTRSCAPAQWFSDAEWRRLVDWLAAHGLDGPVEIAGVLASGTQNELLGVWPSNGRNVSVEFDVEWAEVSVE